MPLCTALLRTWAPLLGLSLLAGPALAQGTYKIGEINSYKAQPAFLEPYKKGMELSYHTGFHWALQINYLLLYYLKLK